MDDIICKSCGVKTFVCNCYPPDLRCGHCGVIIGAENTKLIDEVLHHFGRFGEL